MALNTTRLTNAIKPDIEAKIRSYVLSGDATAYPNLTQFSRALAEAIAAAVVAEITANAVANITIPALAVPAGSFTVGATPVTGSSSTTSTGVTGTIT